METVRKEITARALYLALLHGSISRPLLVVADGNKQAEALLPLIRTFAELLAPGTDPILFPFLDVLPGQSLSPHAEILAARASALGRLAAGYPGIVIAPVAASRRMPRRRNAQHS